MTNKPSEVPNRVVIKCSCGEELTLERIGGQYQHEYQKKCKCGQEWILAEISELIKEIEDCGDISQACS